MSDTVTAPVVAPVVATAPVFSNLNAAVTAAVNAHVAAVSAQGEAIIKSMTTGVLQAQGSVGKSDLDTLETKVMAAISDAHQDVVEIWTKLGTNPFLHWLVGAVVASGVIGLGAMLLHGVHI